MSVPPSYPPQFPAGTPARRGTPSWLWAVAGIVILGLIAGTVAAIANGGTSSGSGNRRGSIEQPGSGSQQSYYAQVSGGQTVTHTGSAHSATTPDRDRDVKVDPASLKLGDCLVPGYTESVNIARKAPCSNVATTLFVSQISTRETACSAPYSRTSIRQYGANYKTVRVLCLTVHWLPNRCYITKGSGANFAPVSCTIAKRRNGVQVKSVHNGTLAYDQACRYPDEGWPDKLHRRVVCTYEFGQ